MTRLSIILAHVALGLTFAAPAQVVSALNAPPSREEFDQFRGMAQTAVQPADLTAAAATNLTLMQGFACAPGSTVPQPEAVSGSPGTASTCLRSDAKLPRITRAGVSTTTDQSGAWQIVWNAPLSATPITLPIPINPGSQPVVCNVTTTDRNGATGRCWLARTLPVSVTVATALAGFDTNASPATGIGVQIVAIPPSQ